MSVTLRNLLSASLAVTPFPRDLNISTTFNNVPEEGRPFWALTRNGVVVRIEANDDHGHFFSGKDRDYTRADLFCWWMDADDLPGTYELSERQQRAEYEAEVEDQQRQYEEG